MKTIAVIGGGITGVTTAYALARRGFSVTLFEKQRYAAMETSFANGGQLGIERRGLDPLVHHPQGPEVDAQERCSAAAQPQAQLAQDFLVLPVSGGHSSLREKHGRNRALAIAAREHLFTWAEREGIDFDLKSRASCISTATRRALNMRAGFRSCWPKAGWSAVPSLPMKCMPSSPRCRASSMAATSPKAIPRATSTSSQAAWLLPASAWACNAATARRSWRWTATASRPA